MPRTARPSETWSSVVASLAVSARVGGTCWPRPSTRAGRLRRQGTERGEHAPALEDGLLPRPEDGHEVVPRPDRVPAASSSARTRGVAEARPVGVLRPELQRRTASVEVGRGWSIGTDPEADALLCARSGSRMSRSASSGSSRVVAAGHRGDVRLGGRLVRDRLGDAGEPDPASAVVEVSDGHRDTCGRGRGWTASVARQAVDDEVVAVERYQMTAWRGPPSGSIVAIVAKCGRRRGTLGWRPGGRWSG